VLTKSGGIYITPALAREYGFTDRRQAAIRLLGRALGRNVVSVASQQLQGLLVTHAFQTKPRQRCSHDALAVW